MYATRDATLYPYMVWGDIQWTIMQSYPSRRRNTAQHSWLRPLTLSALSRLSCTVCPWRTFTWKQETVLEQVWLWNDIHWTCKPWKVTYRTVRDKYMYRYTPNEQSSLMTIWQWQFNSYFSEYENMTSMSDRSYNSNKWQVVTSTICETWHQLSTSLLTDMLRKMSNFLWVITLTTNSAGKVYFTEALIANYHTFI